MALLSRGWWLLKFFPAALVVLLALLWPVSTFVFLGYTSNYWGLFAEQGKLTLQVPAQDAPSGGPAVWLWDPLGDHARLSFGRFRFSTSRVTVGPLPTFTRYDYDIPISFLMLVLLPIAVGSFTRFRFRLWMYFVFVALVAICVVNFRIA